MADHNIFQEVEDDLKRQKLEAVWKKYGPLVVSVAIAIVLVTGISTGWRSWQDQTHQESSAGLLDAMAGGAAATTETGKEVQLTERLTALEDYVAKEKGTAQAVFARFYAARLAIDTEDKEAGNKEKGLKMYDLLSKDTDVEPAFRDLATLLWVQNQMDDADPSVMTKALEPLLTGSAWQFMAKEMVAYLALKMNDEEKAKKIFTELGETKEVPVAIQERAKDMLRWLNRG